jgi:hypothetical protein
LVEVVVVNNNNESRNARAKLKIQGYPNIFIRTIQPAWQVLCLFLACLRKMVAKALTFAKQKGIEKDILDCFVDLRLAMTTVWIPAYAGMTEYMELLIANMFGYLNFFWTTSLSSQ